MNTASFAKDANFESLRLIVLGGEKIIPTDVLAFRKMYGHTEFINHYGPTEATIGAIAGRVDLSEPDAFAKRPTIGRPIANAGVLVLNEALKLVPPGASGQALYHGTGACERVSQQASADSREICRKSIFAGKPHVQNRRCRTKTF